MDKMVSIKKEFWHNKKVLITGHTGFKGSWLTIWLKYLGAKIVGYSLKDEKKDNLYNLIENNIKDEIISFYKNINNFEEIRRVILDTEPDIIFHMAAQSLVIEGYKNPISTWETNLIGSINLLESTKSLTKKCTLVIVTTDKVYEKKLNEEYLVEEDLLGGIDPYSASKTALELAVRSYFESYFKYKNRETKNISIATVRAGNVIGGGDFSANRIIPDTVKSLSKKKPILIRNPDHIRPWQHVLDPLCGYLMLAEYLYKNSENKLYNFNFSPKKESHKSVSYLINSIFKIWNGVWIKDDSFEEFKEESAIFLSSKKAKEVIKWESKWNFKKSIEFTINWYIDFYNKKNPYESCLENIIEYMN